MRTNVCYLAGPITGNSYEEATDWREVFKQDLEVNGKIKCLSPMRAKYYLQSERDIKATDNEKLGILSGGPAVVTRDFADTTTSDIVVINLLGAKRVSIGSMMEAAWAFAYHIPVVLVIEKDTENVHAHSMLFAICGYRVDNLDDAKTIVKAFFDEK